MHRNVRKYLLSISLMIFAVYCTNKNNSSTIKIKYSVNIIDSVLICYIDSTIITDSVRYIDSLTITDSVRFIDSVYCFRDTIFTLKNIDNAALYSFITNFHDSMIYKTYAIVYSDTIFRNKRNPFENNKTKFIKWENVIFEMYDY